MNAPATMFSDIPADLSQEAFTTLLSRPGFRLERIVSHGHSSPDDFWYDQPTNEWVLLIQGAARLTLEGQGTIDLKPGSFVDIPAHARHRVEWTDSAGPTIWLALHYERPGESETQG